MTKMRALIFSAAAVPLVVAAITFARTSFAAEASGKAVMPPSEAPRCYGIVSDAEGHPIAGANVEYWQEDVDLPPNSGDRLRLAAHVVTGTDGRFELRTARTRGLLVGRKPGLALAWRELDQRFRPSRDEQQALVMTAPASLSGLVVDDSDRPVAGVTVYADRAYTKAAMPPGMKLYTPGRAGAGAGLLLPNYLQEKPARDTFVARTDAEGRFAIKDFPTNAWALLSVRAPGKALRHPEPTSRAPFMGYRVADSIKLVLEPAGKIEGTVRLEGGQQVPEGVRLLLSSDRPVFVNTIRPIEAAADGSFIINEVPAGHYHVGATFGTNRFPAWVAQTVAVSVEPGQTVRGIEVIGMRGDVLEVTVQGKSDHEPIASVLVSASKPGFGAIGTSDAQGRVWLRLLPGDYRIAPFRDAGQEEPTTAKVEAGKTNRMELNLPPL